MIQLIPIMNLPVFKYGDDIGKMVVDTYTDGLQNGDILVITQKIVSKAEGCEVSYDEIEPSPFALHLAKIGDKDPKVVELVLRESRAIVRMNEHVLITETHHGIICANSGVDRSNSRTGYMLTLPKDPDVSARKIRARLLELTGISSLAIIISDTYGRALRIGTVNCAIGTAGIEPLEDYRGRSDLFGYILNHTVVARADELAAAAGLLTGQAAEGVPIVLIRGFAFQEGSTSANVLNRKRPDALFL